MVRLNSFTIYKNKHNKFSQQYSYFLRNSRMQTLKKVGLQKIFSNFWGHKIISLDLNFLSSFFFKKNFSFMNNMSSVFEYITLSLILFCFVGKKSYNLFLFFSYLLLSKLKFSLRFVKSVSAEVLVSYLSLFKFRIIRETQSRRLLIVTRSLIS